MSKNTLLVTGASGQLGRLVLESLVKTSGNSIIATTRDPAKLADFKSKGVEVRAADFSKASDLASAFKGAERLLLISTDTIGGRVAQHKNAIDAAVKAGVKHIIYTSWVNPDRSKAMVGPEHTETEKLIEASGLSYTILRNSYYTDNALGGVINAVQTGTLAGAQGGGRISYVTRDDCARAAAAALASSDYSNQVLDITGPEALTQVEFARILSEVSGKKITAVDLTAADYKGGLVGAGFPEFVAELFLSFELAAKQGSVSSITTAVKDLTGRAPTSLKDFLIANKKSFVK